MKRFLLVLVLMSSSLTLSAQTKKYTIRDFFRNPEKARFQLSPGGDQIAYLAPWNNRMNIHIQKPGATGATRITSVTDRDISGYFWKNNTSLIYVRDFGGDENYHLFVATTDGKKEKDLTPFPRVRVQITDPLEDFPDEVLIEMNKENPEVFDVYRLNIVTGELKIAAKNPGNISGWLTDHTGAIRAATTTDGVKTSLMVRDRPEGEFRTLIETDFQTSVTPLFFTFDNKNLYVSSNINRDKQAIVLIDITSGKEMEVLYEHPDVDVTDLMYSRQRKVLTMIGYETAKYEYHFLDKETAGMYDNLSAQLKGYRISISGSDKAEKKFIVRTYSDRSLGAVYLYEKASGKLTKLHDMSPWIKEEDMAEMTPVTYTTRDGLTINAYLTLPVGLKEYKNLPVVINPHGGPWARDSWGWNPEVQFLANRGYAVLQMNFRGSTGYGRKFWEMSFKQWGQSMQSDITDGVDYLIKQGIADPARVAIYGASYGGYATLAGITQNPDLYACAIDYVGVSNLFTFMNTIPPYWKPYLEMMYSMVGNPGLEGDSIMMRRVSPVFNVDNIVCPLFIAQGAKDPRVNKAESDQMVEALKKRNVEVQYLVKENEGHGFRNEENKFEFYGAMEQFLSTHLLTKREIPIRVTTPQGR